MSEHPRRYAARTPLPPGYRVVWLDEDEHYHWVRSPVVEGDDEVTSVAAWNHWACWRGAWANYRAWLAPELPLEPCRSLTDDYIAMLKRRGDI